MSAVALDQLAEVVALPLPTDHWRPATRGECPTERPCPYVGCRHHLYLEVSPSGELRLAFPGRDPDELAESCALDVAERGGASLDEVGRCFGLTGERIRQIEAKALAKAKIALRRLGLRAQQIIPEVEQWRDEDEERPLRRPCPVAAEPAPRLSSDEQVWWFGEPPESQEEQVAAARALAEMRQRRLADAAGEVEEVTTMEATAKTTSEHEQPTPTLCPCGCGREVAPGRTYGSKGCAGRMRWRGVGNPKEAPAPEEQAQAAEPVQEPQSCGHPTSAIVSSDEGTNYCGACEEHVRYEEQLLRHSIETIRRHNERLAELEKQLVEANQLAEERLAHQQVTVREEPPREEASALTARLEAAEAENSRLLASFREECRQRAEIDAALGLTVAPLDAVIAEIRRLQEHQVGPEEPEGEPVDLVALPRPEDLPAAYLFRVLRWGLRKAHGISELACCVSEGSALPDEER